MGIEVIKTDVGKVISISSNEEVSMIKLAEVLDRPEFKKEKPIAVIIQVEGNTKRSNVMTEKECIDRAHAKVKFQKLIRMIEKI